MRTLPFFKGKKGVQFAGSGIDSGGGGGGGSYTLPPATSETLGGVKIGSGVNVTSDGTISVDGNGLTKYEFSITPALPSASDSQKYVSITADLNVSNVEYFIGYLSATITSSGNEVHYTNGYTDTGVSCNLRISRTGGLSFYGYCEAGYSNHKIVVYVKGR